jgi:hypothetical protein
MLSSTPESHARHTQRMRERQPQNAMYAQAERVPIKTEQTDSDLTSRYQVCYNGVLPAIYLRYHIVDNRTTMVSNFYRIDGPKLLGYSEVELHMPILWD